MEETFKTGVIRMLAGIALVAAIAVSPLGAQGIDPRGIYLNSFTGQFSGTEWFQVIPGPEGRFLMTDIRGGGFPAAIDPDGGIVLTDGGGSFSGGDNLTLTVFGGDFTFMVRRVAFTDTEFPLQLSQGQPQSGNPAFGGTFTSRTQIFDPASSLLTSDFEEVLDIDVDGTTLRITDPQGLFFQGVFVDEGMVAFRDIREPQEGIFASFPGSSQNVGQDMLGELRFEDADHFTATVLLQTLAPLGSEQQTLVRFTAVRLPQR
jgi:hypothetical protein